MMDMFSSDIGRCIRALEYYITDWEEDLIKNEHGGTDMDWDKVSQFKQTLNNMRFMGSIYGHE